MSLEKLIHSDEPDIIVPIFYSRDILLKVGGHDPSVQAGEDWDLWTRVRKIGAKSNFVKSVQIHHEFVGLGDYLRKKYFWSLTISPYVSRYNISSLQRAIPVTPKKIWRKRNLVRRHALCFGGLLIMFTMKAYIGGFGMMFRFLVEPSQTQSI